MIWRAVAAIEAGMCKACLCMTGSSRRKRPPPKPTAEGGAAKKASTGWNIPDRSPFAEFEVPYGNIGANVGYAMIANRYLHEYGATPEQLAKVAVHQRDNACANPDAIFYGQPITVDDVLDSPMVADPLHLLEIVMPAGGAAALVVVGPELAASLGRPAAWLLGAGEQVTHKTVTYAPSLTDTAIQASASRAFAQAGVTPDRIGLASVYDCYTITVLLTLEDSGFCPKGDGGRFIEEHDPPLERGLPGQHPRRPALLRSTGHRRRDEPRDRSRPTDPGPGRRPPDPRISTWPSSTATAESCPSRSASCSEPKHERYRSADRQSAPAPPDRPVGAVLGGDRRGSLPAPAVPSVW